MEPASVVGIVGSALGISVNAAQVGYKLYQFIQDTKDVDDTVRGLQCQVGHLGDVCKSVETQLKLVPDANLIDQQLLARVGFQLSDCQIVITKIDAAIKPMIEVRKFFTKQAKKQFRLMLKQSEIDNCRRRIDSYMHTLQITLQLITLQAVYLAPQRANQSLLVTMQSLQELMQGLDSKLNTALYRQVHNYLLEARTFYSESVANGSVVGPEDIEGQAAVLDWLENLEEMSLVDGHDLEELVEEQSDLVEEQAGHGKNQSVKMSDSAQDIHPEAEAGQKTVNLSGHIKELPHNQPELLQKRLKSSQSRFTESIENVQVNGMYPTRQRTNSELSHPEKTSQSRSFPVSDGPPRSVSAMELSPQTCLPASDPQRRLAEDSDVESGRLQTASDPIPQAEVLTKTSSSCPILELVPARLEATDFQFCTHRKISKIAWSQDQSTVALCHVVPGTSRDFSIVTIVDQTERNAHRIPEVLTHLALNHDGSSLVATYYGTILLYNRKPNWRLRARLNVHVWTNIVAFAFSEHVVVSHTGRGTGYRPTSGVQTVVLNPRMKIVQETTLEKPCEVRLIQKFKNDYFVAVKGATYRLYDSVSHEIVVEGSIAVECQKQYVTAAQFAISNTGLLTFWHTNGEILVQEIQSNSIPYLKRRVSRKDINSNRSPARFRALCFTTKHELVSLHADQELAFYEKVVLHVRNLEKSMNLVGKSEMIKSLSFLPGGDHFCYVVVSKDMLSPSWLVVKSIEKQIQDSESDPKLASDQTDGN